MILASWAHSKIHDSTVHHEYMEPMGRVCMNAGVQEGAKVQYSMGAKKAQKNRVAVAGVGSSSNLSERAHQSHQDISRAPAVSKATLAAIPP